MLNGCPDITQDSKGDNLNQYNDSVNNQLTDPTTKLSIPSQSQLKWHEDEIGAFYHFNVRHPIKSINLSQFNPEEIVNTALNIGANRIVIVAKHFNGFNWWPTQFNTGSPYNIGSTRYKGNPVKELIDEAHKQGLRVGIYLATRDDHFGAGEKGYISDEVRQEEYTKYYMDQAKEVLKYFESEDDLISTDTIGTKPKLAEWWLDGGVIDSIGSQLNTLLNTQHKSAVVFQGGYATLRWIGNEKGKADYPTWNTISKSAWKKIKDTEGSDTVSNGDPDGVRWVPAEAATSITTQWLRGNVLSLDKLMSIYYNTVGHGVGLLLNFPIDENGDIADETITRSKEFGAKINSSVNSTLYRIDNQKSNTVVLNFNEKTEIDHVIVEEDLRYGERIRLFHIDGWDDDKWNRITEGTAIGSKQIRKLAEPASYSSIKLQVKESKGTAIIKSLSVTRTGKVNDKSAPSIPVNLRAEVFENQITLKWDVSTDFESSIAGYNIYRNGKYISTVSYNKQQYTDINLAENTEYEYQVSAKNEANIESAKSESIQVRTLIDLTSPTILSSEILADNRSFEVSFSEDITALSAENIQNYSIKPKLKIISATYDSKKKSSVTLSFGSIIEETTSYMLLISNIQDTAEIPNTIDSNTKVFLYRSGKKIERYWKMDRVTDSTVIDTITAGQSIGNNLDLKHTTWIEEGKINGAIKFDGVSSYANAKQAELRPNFTLSLWIKPDGPFTKNKNEVLLSKQISGNQEYQLRLYLKGGKPGFMMSNQNGEDYGLWPFESSQAISEGIWTHLAVVCKENKLTLYVNGTTALSKTLTDTINIPYNTINMLLGATWDSSKVSTTNHYKGAMDEVKLYSEAINTSYLREYVFKSNLIRHWKMDVIKDNDYQKDQIFEQYTLDSVTGENKMTLNGPRKTEGKINDALDFNGVSYGEIDDFTLGSDFTIILWIYPYGPYREPKNGRYIRNLHKNQILIGKGRSGKSENQFRLYLDEGRLGFMKSSANGDDFGLWPFEKKTQIDSGKWSQIAVIVTKGYHAIFVNGKKSLERHTSDFEKTDSNNNPMIIGGTLSNYLFPRVIKQFRGKIDDIQIYSTPLYQYEILKLYQNVASNKN